MVYLHTELVVNLEFGQLSLSGLSRECVMMLNGFVSPQVLTRIFFILKNLNIGFIVARFECASFRLVAGGQNQIGCGLVARGFAHQESSNVFGSGGAKKKKIGPVVV